MYTIFPPQLLLNYMNTEHIGYIFFTTTRCRSFWFIIIGRTANFCRWFSVAQWSDASLRACAVTLFCLSSNSDVEIIGSLLLVHCMLLPHAVCLFLTFPPPPLSLLFLSADEISCSRDSLSSAGCEGHRPSIISAPIPAFQSSCCPIFMVQQ
jgi:hypothetical protein